ncbi:cobyrinate a,c-diamide synthase [Thermosulfuriphilus sp.]
MKGFIISGTHSGCGKTTVSLAIMAALVRRGLKVAPFKVGPDFIDPGHHRKICGRPSYNLDHWMIPLEKNLVYLRQAAQEAQVAVVEGVMGLFDGSSATDESGSTAALAKALGLPVVLVVEARSLARSVAAVVRGFESFDPHLRILGVILNRVGSKRHEFLLTRAIETYCQSKVLGALPRKESLFIPSRHLGLVDSQGFSFSEEVLSQLADWIESGVDLDRLLNLAPEIPSEGLSSQDVPSSGPLIVYAFDEAFSFYYQANLEALRAAGATLQAFSPLREGLPDKVAGIYLGGGYPELFAERLAENRALKEDLREAWGSGIPIYAECGGFMFLTRGLRRPQGLIPWAGIFPFEVEMGPRYRALGYREILLERKTIFGPKGKRARGHEFHYSHLLGAYDGPRAYLVFDAHGQLIGQEGFLRDRVLGSYIHLHFDSNPSLVRSLVSSIRG